MPEPEKGRGVKARKITVTDFPGNTRAAGRNGPAPFSRAGGFLVALLLWFTAQAGYSYAAPAGGRSAVHMVALGAWLGHASVAHTWWYHESTEALLGEVALRTEAFHGEDAMTQTTRHASAFVSGHLPREKGADPHTVDACSQALSLLLRFAAHRLQGEATAARSEQIDAELVLAFLEYVERKGASVSTRNARLAAVKAFFRFVEWREPGAMEQAARNALIPKKKANRTVVAWLTRAGIRALLDTPDQGRRDKIRDRAMLHLTYACGLRVSELTTLKLEDYDRRAPAGARIMGKGRREWRLPLWKETRSGIGAWLRLRDPEGDPELFHNLLGRRLSRWGFNVITRKARKSRGEDGAGPRQQTRDASLPALQLHTLQVTGDVRKVSLWLGHATIQSIEVYLHADTTENLEMLEDARKAARHARRKSRRTSPNIMTRQ